MLGAVAYTARMTDRIIWIKRAALLSLAGNGLLAAAKLLAGFLAGSLAVIGDGIDSSTDVVISLVALIAAGFINKPSDREHPYGHSRAETTATTILSFVIFFAGAQLLLSSLHSLLENRARELPSSLAIWVSLVSVAGKLLLAWSQFAIGRRTSSAMLLANGKNMRNDVLMSATVLLGVLVTTLLRLPLIDTVLAMVVSLWVMKSAVGVFSEANDELMDGKADPVLYQAVFGAVHEVAGAANPHRVRVRKLASLYDIDLDIEVDGDLPVREAHEICQAVELAIKARIDNVYDIVVHIEPAGGGKHVEQFGLDEATFQADEPPAAAMVKPSAPGVP